MRRFSGMAGIALVLAAGVIVASAAAQSVSGTYILERVGSSGLPATVEVEGDCREEVLAATLTLNANDTWRLETRERDVCPNETEDENESATGRYRVSGTTIEFLDDDGESQQGESGDDLDELSTGRIEGTALRVRLGRTETTLQFRRQ
jgi:hypothetical protein